MTKPKPDRRGIIRRWARTILALFVGATLTFFGAGAYAVYQGREQRQNTCEEVQELRDDVVKALNILTQHPNNPSVIAAKAVLSEPNC